MISAFGAMGLNPWITALDNIQMPKAPRLAALAKAAAARQRSGAVRSANVIA